VWAFCTGGVPLYDGGVLPSGGRADTDCAFVFAAKPANNPILRTADLSELTMRGLSELPNSDQSYFCELEMNIPHNVAVQQ
jgi:hypothetical protein